MNCLLKHVIEGEREGRIQVTGIRRKHQPDDVKETSRYWKLKEEVLDRFWGKLPLEEAMDLLYGK
jgi:hypothetical protein